MFFCLLWTNYSCHFCTNCCIFIFHCKWRLLLSSSFFCMIPVALCIHVENEVNVNGWICVFFLQSFAHTRVKPVSQLRVCVCIHDSKRFYTFIRLLWPHNSSYIRANIREKQLHFYTMSVLRFASLMQLIRTNATQLEHYRLAERKIKQYNKDTTSVHVYKNYWASTIIQFWSNFQFWIKARKFFLLLNTANTKITASISYF